MIFHPPCCLLPLNHRVLLLPFITSTYHQHLVTHTRMEFVTLIFKTHFPFFRTIANILNNTCSIFHLLISYVSIRLFLIPWQVCGVWGCTNPDTVAQVCLSAENMGRFVRCDFIRNTGLIFPTISSSSMSLLFLREHFSPNYSIFRSQIYLQLFKSPWKLIYIFTNVTPTCKLLVH